MLTRAQPTDRTERNRNAIILENVSKTFTANRDDEVTAIADVCLTVPTGQFLAVVGESGSGKSTLMHCAAGLSTPTAGSVTVHGTDLSAMGQDRRSRFRAREIGFVFQEYNLVSSLTVAQNVELPARITPGLGHAERTPEVLATVGLGHRAHHLPHELSGGEQQRVALARVFATRPSIVFADEPTSALDLGSSAHVLQHLRQLADEGSTVVMVTHDIDAALWADRTVVMAHARTVDDLAGPSRDQLVDRVMAAQQVTAK
ncbi:ABC transporter ATP-binding protein [Kytococcus sedentarius]|uniref:ABC transporter ATP-binding protein n=1 Tax=Kytococcus sedentarius TaxID=1276 RepID=UPI00384C6DD8